MGTTRPIAAARREIMRISPSTSLETTGGMELRYLYSNLERSQSCVVGAGPAGLMLDLLARSGVDVTVIEKHQDFLRDFRGDTIHPSTPKQCTSFGYLDELLTLPIRKPISSTLRSKDARSRSQTLKPPTRQVHRVHAPMGFPEFSGTEGSGISRFRLLMSTEITSLPLGSRSSCRRECSPERPQSGS